MFDPDYLAKIDKIKLPNTKIKLLQQLLAKAIDSLKKTNKLKGVDFSKQFSTLIEKYNDRSEADVLQSTVLEDFTDEIIDLYHATRKERESFAELGIDFALAPVETPLTATDSKLSLPLSCVAVRSAHVPNE